MDYAKLIYKYINNSSKKLIKHIKEIENNSYNNFHKIDSIDYEYNYPNNTNNNIIYRFDLYQDFEKTDQTNTDQNGGSTQTIDIDGNEYILDLYDEKVYDPDDLFFNKENRTDISKTDDYYKVLFAMPLRKKNDKIMDKIPSNMCFVLVYKTRVVDSWFCFRQNQVQTRARLNFWFN